MRPKHKIQAEQQYWDSQPLPHSQAKRQDAQMSVRLADEFHEDPGGCIPQHKDASQQTGPRTDFLFRESI